MLIPTRYEIWLTLSSIVGWFSFFDVGLGHGLRNKFAPSLKYVKFHYARDLMTLGIKFFIIQMAGVILYQTNNIIIAQLFGPV
jgi:hypothetical protein